MINEKPKSVDLRFNIIKEVFSDWERARKTNGMPLFRETYVGIWGTSNLDETFLFYSKVHLEDKKKLVDLGAGDGRMVFLASLFTHATGIEFDDELYKESLLIKALLVERGAIMSDSCELIKGDYMTHDFSEFDFIITYYDKMFEKNVEEKISKECSGEFWLYNNIFLPTHLKKEKIVWAAQMPFIKVKIRKGVVIK